MWGDDVPPSPRTEGRNCPICPGEPNTLAADDRVREQLALEADAGDPQADAA